MSEIHSSYQVLQVQPENLIGDGENFLPSGSFAKCLPAYYVPFIFDYRANIN